MNDGVRTEARSELRARPWRADVESDAELILYTLFTYVEDFAKKLTNARK